MKKNEIVMYLGVLGSILALLFPFIILFVSPFQGHEAVDATLQILLALNMAIIGLISAILANIRPKLAGILLMCSGGVSIYIISSIFIYASSLLVASGFILTIDGILSIIRIPEKWQF